MIYSSGGRYSTSITYCSYPSNENEVIQLINIARETNSSVRATGKSHSKSGVNMMEEQFQKNLFLVNMSENMNNIIEVNENENTMTFEAGLSTYDVLRILESYNLALKYWVGGPLTTNFAGHIITGTHGMGTNKNPIPITAENVINLRMVIANGSVITANNTFNKDIFDAARVSFGAFGIITEITVQTQPIYNGTMYSGNYFQNVSNIQTAEQIIENNISHYINYYDTSYCRYFIYSQFIDVGFKIIFNDSTISPQKCVTSVEENIDNKNLGDTALCTDIYWKTFGGPPGPGGWSSTSPINQAIEYEYFVNAELWKESLIGVFKWIFDQKKNNTYLWRETQQFRLESDPGNGRNYNPMIQWRFIGMDSIWLSPGFNRTVFQIGMTFHEDIWPLLPDRSSLRINDLWTFGLHQYLQNNFAPVTYHWGKQSLSDYCDVQKAYPKLNDFQNLRSELDPNGIFINNFMRDKLGICNLENVDGGCCCTNSTCKSFIDSSKDKKQVLSTAQIIMIVIGTFVGFTVIVLLCICICKQTRRPKDDHNKKKVDYKAVETIRM